MFTTGGRTRECLSASGASPPSDFAAGESDRHQRPALRSRTVPESPGAGALATLQPTAPAAWGRLAEEGSREDGLPPKLAPLHVQDMGTQGCLQGLGLDSSSTALSPAAEAGTQSTRQLQPQPQPSAGSEHGRSSNRRLLDARCHGQELELVDCSPGSKADVVPAAQLTPAEWMQPSPAAGDSFPPAHPGAHADVPLL